MNVQVLVLSSPGDYKIESINSSTFKLANNNLKVLTVFFI